MKSKLSAADWASVRQLADAGKTSIEIEATLRERGLEIHQSNIRRWLAKNRTETTQATEAQNELDRHAREFLDRHGRLPDVPSHIKTVRAEEMRLDTPQPAIALFSDLHYGSRIDPRATGGLAEYNIDICRERLSRYRNALLRFHQIDSFLIDIPELHLFALGDDLEGHGAMFPTQALQMDESLLFQYMGFVTDVTEVLLSLLERYPKIIVYKVYGNHGRVSDTSQKSYGPDNIELMAWEHIADRVRSQTGGEWTTSRTGIHSLMGGAIEFHISRSFFILAEIEGHLIYGRHGHRIGGLQRTYTGAYDNKLRMNTIVSDKRLLNIMFKAHLHEAQEQESEIGGQVVQNGCFVGPSLLSVEMQRASASLPSQEMFLIHPKHGLTHHHRIRLATPGELRQAEMVRNTEDAVEVIRVAEAA